MVGKSGRAGADGESPQSSSKYSTCLPSPCQVEKSPHSGNAVGRNAYALGAFLDDSFVRREVDAVDFVAGSIPMEPLGLGTPCVQNLDRFLGHFL
jgi:hypothetical protein